MINYTTNTFSPPPPLQAMAAQGANALANSPYEGQSHQDVYQTLGQRQAVNLDAYARRAGEAYANAAQQAQRELALAGLQMAAQGQQQGNNLAASRTQMLLRGLL
jgi:hypothetical protein